MKVDKIKQDSGGGLRDLLDWNMKSRKKFSTTPDSSEQSKQKRSSDRNIPITMSKGDMLKGRSSSLIEEDDHGKVPGVVARLMGLDSLPNSSFNHKPSNRFFDSRNNRKRIELDHKDYHQIDPKHKVIDKFQTEILPPKPVKSARITPQKLVSPIKSSRIVSPNDPQKLASRKPLESNAARKLKGQSMNKSWDGCLQRKPFMEEGKKSDSLAKIHLEKREPKKPCANSVLKQNNQKQNCVIGRGKPAAKSPVTLTHRKPISGKSSSKIPANSTNRAVNQSKRDKYERNRHVGNSNGSDVVSFTFTSPISRTQEKKKTFLGDNYGTLLDKKLRELTATFSGNSVSRESSSTRYIARINTTPIHKDDSCSGFQNQELVPIFPKKPTTMEVETESEPNYVNDILSHIKSMFDDFSLGRSRKIVNPRLFDVLEAQRQFHEKKNEGKLRRKLVFDCVSECVDSRCRVWTRGLSVVRRKKRLVKEVCNKISGWEEMKDCMVDELVDKDMSCDEHQKWLDFDVEAFEIGVEIERRLLDSLINDAVADILVP